MIKLEVNKGHVEIKMEGLAIDLLAETPMAFGKVLRNIVGHFPKGLKDELVKTTFELTLKSMMEDDEQ